MQGTIHILCISLSNFQMNQWYLRNVELTLTLFNGMIVMILKHEQNVSYLTRLLILIINN